MNKFICPVCGENLELQQQILKCSANHCYDVAKQGYVNLLRSQQSSKKRHGDDKLMLKARHEFLSQGYYNLFLEQIILIIKKYSQKEYIAILDSGCGDGYYSSVICRTLNNCDMYCIDISRDAVLYAAKQYNSSSQKMFFAAASCSKLPIMKESIDFVLNIFSPAFPSEFSRVLKHDGFLIKAFPLENHLFGLKKIIYDSPYKNKPEKKELYGFSIVDYKEIKFNLHLDKNEDIINLFKMTPYYYKTSRQDQSKLESLTELDTEAEFGIVIYKKI